MCISTVYIYLCLYVYVCVSQMYIYIPVFICIYVCISNVYIYTCLYIYIFVSQLYIYIYIPMFIYVNLLLHYYVVKEVDFSFVFCCFVLCKLVNHVIIGGLTHSNPWYRLLHLR